MIDRWADADAAALLRSPGPSDDKYRRGVLGMRTGGAQYPGAAVLGVSAAWRAGAGMVRYAPPIDEASAPWGLPSPAAAVLAAQPETVFGAPTDRSCDAWVIGSGTDAHTRSAAEDEELRSLLGGDAPLVVDAGALDLVPGVEPGVKPGLVSDRMPQTRGARAAAILTPHGGEFERLWRASDVGALPNAWDARGLDLALRSELAARLASALRATVLLKGSVTICATPGGWVRRIGPATPWLATAGTGDVLAGTLGALVAGHASAVRANPELLGPVGATAALLHDRAARIAATDRGESGVGAGRPITASDVAAALPDAWTELAHPQSR
ncbi:ADP-dependent NAD(P)H-hydrate dehydratase [Leucobacter japonicus]|uniref:ADP-dependent NAD(P)H-hydrate dehydratase n=1 Tax=Leucobacter japonicus TaxID=1461259 RepID=UPI0006A78587|nr:ADP/ATP-dependent (S)-NAD(P)H-hydrate dehydratase [Leucobacter japonicus]